MDVRAVVELLRARSALASRDRWSRDDLLAHQTRALATLRSFALARSPFYREFHRGLETAPLDALPILTKAMLMERFDEFVTDRDIRFVDVEAHLRAAGPTDLFRGRYRVAATGGTTGRRGVFLADRSEWTSVLASYARANDWAGVPAGLRHRLRVAVVSSRNPHHQSSIVGATLASPIVPTLRLEAADPIARTTEALNGFKPDSLVGYASILKVLADEQLAGRLNITPRAVMSASEVLTPESRGRIKAAFGIEPFNVYAATETAGIASECVHHRLHRYEDLVIAEIVDEENRPAAPGEFGAKLLVTVLFSRTQPLIRYEVSDRVRASLETCPDGRPFGLFDAIEGREEDVLHLNGIAIYPNIFHSALEPVPVAGWQVVEEPDGLLVLLAQPSEEVVDADVAMSVRGALRQAGADGIRVRVERVDAITRTALGKAPLVRAIRRERRPWTRLPTRSRRSQGEPPGDHATMTPEQATQSTADTSPLADEELDRIDAYWRAANYLSVGQIYLLDNPLLREPLRPEHIKPRLLGHWGTTPGLNFVYAHANRVIKARDLDAIYVIGPGHGGPATVANAYLEGTYSEVFPNITRDEDGHAPAVPAVLLPGRHRQPRHARDARLDPRGRRARLRARAMPSARPSTTRTWSSSASSATARRRPGRSPRAGTRTSSSTRRSTAPSSRSSHLNGYKIANPTILARIPREELTSLFEGYGYRPVVRGGRRSGRHAPADGRPYSTRSSTTIAAIQRAARAGRARPERRPHAGR